MGNALPYVRYTLLGLGAMAVAALFLFFGKLTLGEQTTLGILILGALLWATELLPLFATSLLLIVALCVTMPHVSESSYTTFLAPFASPVLMLFFGGFVLAKALSKHGIDLFFAERVLARTASSPKRCILSLFGLALALSMWLSNTAAAAILCALAKPIFDKSNFSKQTALAIAFGANIGGIATPIGTPPNAIVIGILAEKGISVTFPTWFALTLPLVALIGAIASFILLYSLPKEAKPFHFSSSQRATMSRPGLLTCVIFLLTVALWLTQNLHHIHESVIALLSVATLATCGIITAEDIQHLPWDILLLMWGGLALGEAVMQTGLADYIHTFAFIEQYPYGAIIIVSALALLLSSIISNTATANIILPLAVSIPAPDKAIAAIPVALACSFACALPIATPPNAICYSQGHVSSRDFLLYGGLLSVCSLIVVLIGFDIVIPYFIKGSS